jgi:hypothetical protein
VLQKRVSSQTGIHGIKGNSRSQASRTYLHHRGTDPTISIITSLLPALQIAESVNPEGGKPFRKSS